MLELVLAAGLLGAFGLAAQRWGAESRDGFRGERQRVRWYIAW